MEGSSINVDGIISAGRPVVQDEGATTGGDEYKPLVQLNSKLQPSLAVKMK